ncbi:MAG: ABC transporter ATP-binding protein [bacterium]
MTTTTTVAARAVGATKIYGGGEGEVRALDGVDVEFEAGRFTAIMGPSGSGKSTLMHCLAGLDRLSSGRVFIGDTFLDDLNDSKLTELRRDKVGFVFQAFNLISELSIAENVEVPLLYQGISANDRRARAHDALKLVGLENRVHHRPRELSGGQQQRAAIARALVGSPAILMADEPTGNLDSHTGQAILETFEELHSRGLTLIMVTHDDRIAGRCQRVVRLKDGELESDRDGGGRRRTAEDTR